MLTKNPSKTVLILGGTREARDVAQLIVDDAYPWAVTTSLAGAVSRPVLPVGDVRIGGFGGAAGLADYLRSRNVAAVIDATHPFAASISSNAANACRATTTPRIRLQRKAYPPLAGVAWHRVETLTDALNLASTLGQRVFLTTGRRELAPTTSHPQLHYVIRCVDEPDPGVLPPNHDLILTRGPFHHDQELRTMNEHAIDVLVCKDSGGDLTYGKLTAAAALNIPVVMVSRPPTPEGPCVDTAEQVLPWLHKTMAVQR